MTELTQEQIDKLDDGEEVVIEIEVWHGDDPSYQMPHTVVLVKEGWDDD